MIYIAIIEDDKIYTDYTKSLLVQWAKAKTSICIYSYINGSDIFGSKQLRNFDIIFIDMKLGNEYGMETAKRLRDSNYKKEIVFVTNYECYAIEGYTVNAYRYYLKPIQLRDIQDCMDYVFNKFHTTYFQYIYQGVESRVDYEDIVCFESMQHYVDIFVNNKTSVHIKESLKNIQDKCPPYFIRCQRSYIVNSHHISERRGNKLLLSNGKVIDISPRQSKAVSKIMIKKEDNNG